MKKLFALARTLSQGGEHHHEEHFHRPRVDGPGPPRPRPRTKEGSPDTVEVTCQGVNGTLIIAEQRVICACSSCMSLSEPDRSMTCTQFEIHAGAATAKKWKMSIKVRPGSEPDVPASGPAVQIGKWLESRGIDVGKPMFRMSTNLTVPVSKDSQLVFPQERVYTSQRLAARQQRRKSDGKDGRGGDIYTSDFDEEDDDGEEDSEEENEEEEIRQMIKGKPPSIFPGGGWQQDKPSAPQQQQRYSQPSGVSGKQKQQREDSDNLYTSSGQQQQQQYQHQSKSAGGGTAGSGGGWAAEKAPPPGPTTTGPAAGATTQGKQPTPWRDASERNFTSINVRWSGERCCVCDADTDYDYDQLVMCDMCGITVHQSCYGVQEVPGVEDMWLCRACELREEGRAAPQCCLCPVAGGALKPTTMQGIWCHAACLQWIPEVTVEDVDLMEPVSGIRSIQRERWELLCTLCKQRMGAKIQCQSCYTAYHPLCGRIAGFYMDISDGPQGPDGAVVCSSYCAKHRPPKPHQSGVRKVEESEAGGDLPDILETPALFNGQPYALPRAAPLPACEAGCARAMPLGPNWVRKQHGTGSGATTEAAFWIPEEKSNENTRKKRKLNEETTVEKQEEVAMEMDKDATAGTAAIPAVEEKVENVVEIVVAKDEEPAIITDACPAAGENEKEVPRGGGGGDDIIGVSNGTAVDELVAVEAGGVEKLHHHALGDAEGRRHSSRRKRGREMPAPMAEEDSVAQGNKDQMEIDTDKSLLAEDIPSKNNKTTAIGADMAVKQEETENPVVVETAAVVGAAGPSSAVAAAADSPLRKKHSKHHDSSTQAGETVLRPAVKQPSSSSGERPPAKLRKLNTLHHALPNGSSSLSLASTPPALSNPHALVAGRAPSDLVGSWCRVWWPEDDEWYLGMIKEYSPSKGQFRVWYQVDNEAEWIDLGRECRNGRLQLLPGEDRATWPAPPVHSGRGAAVAGSGGDKVAAPTFTASGEGAEGDRGADLPEGINNRGKNTVGVEEEDDEKQEEEEEEGNVDDKAEKIRNQPPSDLPKQKEDGATTATKTAVAIAPSGTAEKILGDDGTALGRKDTGRTNIIEEPEEQQEAEVAPSGPAEGTAAIGRKVGVFWEEEGKYFYGTIRSYRTDKGHMVLYDNGTVDWVDVATSRIDWSGTKVSAGGRRGNAGPNTEGGVGGGKHPFHRKLPDNVPETLSVVCNSIRGAFNLRRLVITLRQTGAEVTPTEFERQAGRAAAKKWKTSIRIDKGDGVPGITMESWLVAMGIDEARAARPSKGTLSGIRRRQVSRGVGGGGSGLSRSAAGDEEEMITNGGGSGRSGRLRFKPGHRNGCMCVICKQARKSGKVWAGMTDKKNRAVNDANATEGGDKSHGHIDPKAIRYGKRAYVEAVPQVLGTGPKPVLLHKIPPSRCWTSSEWAAHRLRYHIAKDAERTGDAPPPALAQAAPPVLLAGGSSAILEDNFAASVSLGPGATGGGRTLTLKEKLDLCNATEHERLSFGKSGIHGWGLFAKVPIRQDMMVVEFRGELLRRSAADTREAQYLAEGRDCYIFNLDDDVVLDATRAGTIARFTVRKTSIKETFKNGYFCFLLKVCSILLILIIYRNSLNRFSARGKPGNL